MNEHRSGYEPSFRRWVGDRVLMPRDIFEIFAADFVMRKDGECANISMGLKGVPTRELPRCVTTAFKTSGRDL